MRDIFSISSIRRKRGSAGARKFSFQKDVVKDETPIPESAFDSVYSFGMAIFRYNKMPILMYLGFCTLRSMEHLVRNWPFRSFIIALENLNHQSVTTEELWRVAMWPIIGIVVALLIIDLFYRISALLLAYVVRPNIEYTVNRKVTSMLMHKKYHFFSKDPTSINSRINQLAEGTYDATLMLIEEIVPSSLGALGTVIATWIMDSTVGFILFVYLAMHMIIMMIFYKKYIRLASCNATSHNMLIRQTLNLVQNMSQVKGFGMEHFENTRINTFQDRRRRTSQKAFSYPEKMKMALTINHIIAFVLVLLVQIKFFSSGRFGVADITFVMGNLYGVIQLLYFATNASMKMVEDIGRSSESVEFFKEGRSENELRINKKHPKTLANGSVTFDDVTFIYPGANKSLFKGQSVSINDGEKIGVVGLSGSGKSTFVNLIMGYFLPSAGSVIVGGYDTKETDLSWLRRHVTMVTQLPQLFDRTILANIQYGRQKMKYQDITNLCHKLGMDNFIKHMPHGYFTSVIDGGRNLSGGQKQRIAVARAVAKESAIVILDEATSAMDNHTQSVVSKGIAKLVRGKTAIVIAHKLETVVSMDRILVFKDGAIIEQGTHQELMLNDDSHYKYLWELSKSNAYNP